MCMDSPVFMCSWRLLWLQSALPRDHSEKSAKWPNWYINTKVDVQRCNSCKKKKKKNCPRRYNQIYCTDVVFKFLDWWFYQMILCLCSQDFIRAEQQCGNALYEHELTHSLNGLIFKSQFMTRLVFLKKKRKNMWMRAALLQKKVERIHAGLKWTTTTLSACEKSPVFVELLTPEFFVSRKRARWQTMQLWSLKDKTRSCALLTTVQCSAAETYIPTFTGMLRWHLPPTLTFS